MKSIEHNLYSVFASRFPKNRNKVLLDAGAGGHYTYADAQRESALLAAFLTSLGLVPGARITVQVEKSPRALWLYLACLRAGFVFHPLNTAYQKSELDYFVGNAEPALVICDQRSEPLFTRVAAGTSVQHILTLNADGSGTLYQRLAETGQRSETPAAFETVARAPDDIAALLYSSGTTGRPKGIMLSHKNLAANAEVLTEAWGFTEKDCLLHALPIFHVHGLFVALGCVLMSGAGMLWLPKFDAARALELLPRATVMMGVPTFYTRLLEQPAFTRETAAGVRLFISGSAPLLAETFKAFYQRTGHRILERYGMTETNMNTSNPLHGQRKPGTVGLPLPGVELRVVDDEGRVLATGEIGNLQVRGPNVFTGYWRMPEKTAEDFSADGYFNTGDKARIDADGYVSIVGRGKDMIISGGLNIYPKEIELLLDSLEGVAESAVIGVPHRDFGEAVVAVVVPDTGASLAEREIIASMKVALAGFKVPKKIIFADTLPRNTMGKVQKNILRETYAGCLG